jgi:hypothetical protein
MRHLTKLAGMFLGMFLAFAAPAQAQVLYGADGAGGNPATNLLILDPATGAVISTVGPIGFSVTGLAFHPVTGVLYGSTGGAAVPPRSIITINTTTGAGTLVGPTGQANPVADLTFRTDGVLFGWTEDGDDLVTINTVTGVATVVGDSGLNTAGSGLAFAPGGELFSTGESYLGSLHRINPATGAVAATVALSASNIINALAYDGAGVLFGADSDNDQLVTIDTTTGVITVVGPTIADLDALAFGPTPAPAGAVAIPTLSQWALVVTALLMLAGGFLVSRKRA